MSKSKILLLMTGSIACYKVCQLISKLTQNGYEVQVAASSSALKFVGAATLEGLSGHKIYSDLWEEGRMMDHIALNRWADLILVAPASASYINRSAHGIGDDLLGTLFLAHDFKKPFLLAPAMNQAMHAHPATQKSLSLLAEMGVQVLPTGEGNLACGEIGAGRLFEPDSIFAEIEKSLQKSIFRSAGRVLVTAGGTSEPVDDVRYLTNHSTGATGAAIADRLSELGFDVTYLHAKNAQLPMGRCHKVTFETFNDLQSEIRQILKKDYVAVIHAAAVSDFSPTKTSGKISSSQLAKNFSLPLKMNPKIVGSLRDWSRNKKLKLIAFKMTSTSSAKDRDSAVEKLFQDSRADLIVQNDMQDIDPELGKHIYYLHRGSKGKSLKMNDKEQLSTAIGNFLLEKQL